MKQALSKKNLWLSLPGPLKIHIGHALRLIPPEYLLGGRFRRWQRVIAESSSWTECQAHAYQIQQMRDILTYAQMASDHYRRSFETIGLNPRLFSNMDEVINIPFTTKAEMRQIARSIYTANSAKAGVDAVSTGGSTGEPLTFLIGKDRSSIEYAHLVDAWSRIGYTLKSSQVVMRGAADTGSYSDRSYSFDPILRRHRFSTFQMDEDTLAQYVDKLRSIPDCFIQAYPSALSLLVRYLTQQSITPLTNVRGLLLGSENIFPGDRIAAERVFGCRYFSWYGHSEKLVFAAECEHSTDYHIYPTYGYFELIDNLGNPVTTPGQRGEIVGTGFVNKITPFIRYRTGDFATFKSTHCDACGRFGPIVSDIQGHRESEMIVGARGDLMPIVGLGLDSNTDTFRGVSRYQFFQEEIGRIIFRVSPISNRNEINIDAIRQHLTKKLSDRVQFEIEIVDEIAPTRDGKARHIEQRLDIREYMKAGQ